VTTTDVKGMLERTVRACRFSKGLLHRSDFKRVVLRDGCTIAGVSFLEEFG
jgi:hypothetical protein